MSAKCYWSGHKEGKSDTLHWNYMCPRCGTYFDRSKFRNTFWDSDTYETIRGIFNVVLVIGILVFLVAGIPSLIIYKQCSDYFSMGIPTQYHFWTGCMANHPKLGWIPVQEYFKTINLLIH